MVYVHTNAPVWSQIAAQFAINGTYHFGVFSFVLLTDSPKELCKSAATCFGLYRSMGTLKKPETTTVCAHSDMFYHLQGGFVSPQNTVQIKTLLYTRYRHPLQGCICVPTPMSFPYRASYTGVSFLFGILFEALFTTITCMHTHMYYHVHVGVFVTDNVWWCTVSVQTQFICYSGRNTTTVNW